MAKNANGFVVILNWNDALACRRRVGKSSGLTDEIEVRPLKCVAASCSVFQRPRRIDFDVILLSCEFKKANNKIEMKFLAARTRAEIDRIALCSVTRTEILDETQFSVHRTKSVSPSFQCGRAHARARARARCRNFGLMKRIGE